MHEGGRGRKYVRGSPSAIGNDRGHRDKGAATGEVWEGAVTGEPGGRERGHEIGHLGGADIYIANPGAIDRVFVAGPASTA